MLFKNIMSIVCITKIMLGFKKVWMENEELQLLWKVVTFMECCDFHEKLWLLWKVATFMKILWLLWKVVTFMKGDHLYGKLWLFQRLVTFPVRHNKNLFALPFVLYKLRDFLSFYYRIYGLLIQLLNLVI